MDASGGQIHGSKAFRELSGRPWAAGDFEGCLVLGGLDFPPSLAKDWRSLRAAGGRMRDLLSRRPVGLTGLWA